jgi:hypothetical protein
MCNAQQNRIATFDDCGMIDKYFTTATVGIVSRNEADLGSIIDIEIISCCKRVFIRDTLHDAGKEVWIRSATLSAGCEIEEITASNPLLNKLSTDKTNSICKKIAVFQCNQRTRDGSGCCDFSIAGKWTNLRDVFFYQTDLRNTELYFSNAEFGKQQIKLNFIKSFPRQVTLPKALPKTASSRMELFFSETSGWSSPILLSASNLYPLTISNEHKRTKVAYYTYSGKFYVLPIVEKIDGNDPEPVEEITDETEFILDLKYFAKTA